MKCSLERVDQFCGKGCIVYTVIIAHQKETLFDEFVRVCSVLFKSETKDILKRLHAIGHLTGARESFFKMNEGKPGDGLCALYDQPKSHLRLYCIRFGMGIIVLGSGGQKPKNIRALQDDPVLLAANDLLRRIAQKMTELIQEKDLRFSEDGFSGTLEFYMD